MRVAVITLYHLCSNQPRHRFLCSKLLCVTISQEHLLVVRSIAAASNQANITFLTTVRQAIIIGNTAFMMIICKIAVFAIYNVLIYIYIHIDWFWTGEDIKPPPAPCPPRSVGQLVVWSIAQPSLRSDLKCLSHNMFLSKQHALSPLSFLSDGRQHPDKQLPHERVMLHRAIPERRQGF